MTGEGRKRLEDARREGERLHGRLPRLTLAIVGDVREPPDPRSEFPEEKWVLQEKTDHLSLGQAEAEFASAGEAMACLRAYRAAQRAAAEAEA